MEFLAGQFGIDVLGFAVMSNHLHVVLRNRPDVVTSWSDDEVARRWWMLFPQKRDKDGAPAEPRVSDLAMITSDGERLAAVRKRLSNLGWFMRCLAEPIARMSNREDECTGRFWEGRYKCQPLLNEAALTACMAYVDLNPIRASIAKTPESSQFTSAFERLQGEKGPAVSGQRQGNVAGRRGVRGAWLSPVELAESHAAESGPVPSGRASNRGCLAMSQSEYLRLLDWSGRVLRHGKRGAIPSSLPPVFERLGMSEDGWLKLVKDFGRLFGRAAGSPSSLAQEATRREQTWLQGLQKSREVFTNSV